MSQMQVMPVPLIVGLRGRIRAIEVLTGRDLWTVNLSGCGWNAVETLVDNGVVYAASSGHIFAFRLYDGEKLWCSKAKATIASLVCLAPSGVHSAGTALPVVHASRPTPPIPQLSAYADFSQPSYVREQPDSNGRCPLCQKFMPFNVLEQHAASCQGTDSYDSGYSSVELQQLSMQQQQAGMHFHGNAIPQHIPPQQATIPVPSDPSAGPVGFRPLQVPGWSTQPLSAVDLLFLGTMGYIYAYNKYTGERVWKCNLKGSGYNTVQLIVDQSSSQHQPALLAATNGYMYAVDANTGCVLWKNNLSSLGCGPTTFTINGQRSHGPTHI